MSLLPDVTCPDPVVENAYFIERSMPPFKYRSYVTFECLHGYKMDGSKSLTCQIDSVWSKSFPTCVKGKVCLGIPQFV